MYGIRRLSQRRLSSTLDNNKKDMEIPECSQEELLRMWRPQALQKAENGTGAITISQFLKSKGIEEELAITTARELVSEGQKNSARAARPLKIIGWIFIAIGVLTPILTMVSGRGLSVVTVAPVALGAAMVWGGYRGGEE